MISRPPIGMPPEAAQLRGLIGVQALAIEALTRRIAALEADLADMRRGAATNAVSGLSDTDAPMARRTSMADIATAVHVRTGITIADLRGRKRAQPYVLARAIFCAMARRAGYTTPQIGNWLGGRDHTTVMHAARIEERALAYFASMHDVADEVAS